MIRPKAPMILLMLLYALMSVAALWRAFTIQSLDLFTLGVIPVLVGLLLRAQWSGVVLKIYVLLQTLGFGALGVTAIIAYRLTPDDVKVVLNGYQIPMLPLILGIIALLTFQFVVAFSANTRSYLTCSQQQTV